MLDPSAEIDGELEDEAAFEERARSLVARAPSGAPQVIVPRGPLVAPGAYLAAVLGHALVVLDSVDPQVICDLATQRPTTILLAFEETEDSIVFGLLERQDEALASHQSWDGLPRFSLLTARNPSAVTRLVAKIVARPESRDGGPLLRHLWSGAKRLEVLQPQQSPRSEIVGERAVARRVLEAPADAVACSTHGTETCAMGVDGLFLCGRSPSSPITDFPARGQMACGSGGPCLRGPEPMSMRDIAADLMITSSCSSLRLAGSCLDPRFNLALSFLDGPGRAYVGSVLSGAGGEMASKLFLAAYASGHELGTSTMLVNSMLRCFGLDLPSYVCVGAVDMTSHARPTPEIRTFSTSTFEVDAEGALLLEGLVTDAESVALAERGDLVVDVENVDTLEPREAFFRLEAVGDELVVRVIAFQFPEALGPVRVRLLDGSAIMRRAEDAAQALDRWIRLAKSARVLTEDIDELVGVLQYTRHTLRSFQSRSWWASGTADAIASRTQSVLELAREVRGRILAELISGCAGGFWLTNAWMHGEFRNETISRGRCPVCGTASIERILRNPAGESRFVVVCGRDGIMLDTEPGGAIQDLDVRFSDVGGADRLGYAVTVDVQRDPSVMSPIVVRAAISTPGRAEVPCRPAEVVLESGDSIAEFSFELDEDQRPNTHSVKVLAATDREIAFAARKVSTSGHVVAPPSPRPSTR
ncbi:MAG: hypothetical protein H6712_33355 [Myxococcales bacterium]|nr:hypothetical protein [Myxococcales bacterium]